MTAQLMETLIYKGEKVSMAENPLRPYLNKRDDIDFVSSHTACWRGYVVRWKAISLTKSI